MLPIVTDVPWSVCVCVCLLVTTVSSANTAEPIEIPFGMWTHGSPRNRVLLGEQILQGKRLYRGTENIRLNIQSYSVGSSSDAAFRSQYYGNLLHLVCSHLRCIKCASPVIIVQNA